MDKYRIRWVEYRGISKLIMENFAEGSNLAEVCKDAFGKIVYDLRR